MTWYYFVILGAHPVPAAPATVMLMVWYAAKTEITAQRRKHIQRFKI